MLSWVSDILISIVVLNLAIEYSDRIIIDSFTISILTAVLMKALLVGSLRLEEGLSGYFVGRTGGKWTAMRWLATFALLFLSKLVILEALNIVFGDHVKISGYLPLILLILAIMASSLMMRVIYVGLGPTAGSAI